MENKFNNRADRLKIKEKIFLAELLDECINAIRQQPMFFNVFKYLKNEVSESASNEVMLKVMKKLEKDVQENLDTYNSILDAYNKAENKMEVIDMLMEKFVWNAKSHGNVDILTGIKSNHSVLTQYMDIYRLISKIESAQQIIESIDDPIKFVKKVARVNNELFSQMKEMNPTGEYTFYDAGKKFIDSHLDEEFYDLLSLDALKAELFSVQTSSSNNQSMNSVERKFEIVNKWYIQISDEIENLKKINIGEDAYLSIISKKELFDKQFKMPFVQIDDELIVSFANEKLGVIESEISALKARIANALAYAGEDIRDVLRDEQPYILRDYVEKLKAMSNKYDKMFSEANKEDSNELAKLYKKATDLYAVVEEMRNNAYVVDVARLSK